MVISVFRLGHFPESLFGVIRIRGNRSMLEYLQIGTNIVTNRASKGGRREKERKEVYVGMGKWVGVVGGWMEQWLVGYGDHF